MNECIYIYCMILNNIVKLMHAWMTVGLVSDSIRVGPRPGGWQDGGMASLVGLAGWRRAERSRGQRSWHTRWQRMRWRARGAAEDTGSPRDRDQDRRHRATAETPGPTYWPAFGPDQGQHRRCQPRVCHTMTQMAAHYTAHPAAHQTAHPTEEPLVNH